MHLKPGRIFATKYRIERKLGLGTTAWVYLATDLKLKRQVAFKVFTPSAVDPDGTRFAEEIERIAKLAHPNIVSIYESGTEDEVPWMALQLLRGETLAFRAATMSLQEKLSALAQLAQALDYAHAQNVLHRDLKPANVLFDAHSNAVLCDFGISKAVTGTQPSTLPLGTPRYMSPEQCRGLSLGPQSDIYALAVLAFELLVGQAPFTAPEPMAIMLKHVNDPVPTELLAHFSDGTEDVLAKALSKDPLDRFVTAAEFVAELRKALTGPKAIVIADYAIANITLLYQAVAAGDEQAMVTLGNRFQTGKENDLEALRLYRLAADQGNANAQYHLGSMYKEGRGVKRDDEEAVRFFQLAAEQGDATAQNILGRMYQSGCGVKRDDLEAIRLYRLAAEQGNANAQNNLGWMYKEGLGVKRDDEEAVRLFLVVAELGNAAAQYNLGKMYFDGRGVKRDYQEAERLIRLAAERGIVVAQISLGAMYYEALGVKRDFQESIKFFRLAAEQGNATAQNNLGWMYKEGHGVKRDDQEAVRLFQLAAEQGNSEAQNNLGWMYKEGLGVKRDEQEAVRLYRLAADQGDEDAEEQILKLEKRSQSWIKRWFS